MSHPEVYTARLLNSMGHTYDYGAYFDVARAIDMAEFLADSRPRDIVTVVKIVTTEEGAL